MALYKNERELHFSRLLWYSDGAKIRSLSLNRIKKKLEKQAGSMEAARALSLVIPLTSASVWVETAILFPVCYAMKSQLQTELSPNLNII